MISDMRDWSRYEQVLMARRRGLTLLEAGALVGVSRERARQMEAVAIRSVMQGGALSYLAPASERESRIANRHWTS
jgi:Sigma-70, region 4